MILWENFIWSLGWFISIKLGFFVIYVKLYWYCLLGMINLNDGLLVIVGWVGIICREWIVYVGIGIIRY